MLEVHREVPLGLPGVIEGVVELCFAVEVELLLRADGSGVILEYCGARDVPGPATVLCEEGVGRSGANELAQGRAGYVRDRECGFGKLAHWEPFYDKPAFTSEGKQ